MKKKKAEAPQAHNSKYWRYLNTGPKWDLQRWVRAPKLCGPSTGPPTFADFRGRIYTLSNYLSWLGAPPAPKVMRTLSRSLLLVLQR